MADYYKRCEKARIIEHGPNPEWWCVCHGYENDSLIPLPEGALVIEQPDKEERTWYCERFGTPGDDPSICAMYEHRESGYDCGERLLVKPAAVGKED